MMKKAFLVHMVHTQLSISTYSCSCFYKYECLSVEVRKEEKCFTLLLFVVLKHVNISPQELKIAYIICFQLFLKGKPSLCIGWKDAWKKQEKTL